MNGLDRALMPKLTPDMPQRLDLDGLGAFIANLAAAGMPLFPDDELQTYLRDAAGLPEITDPAAIAMLQAQNNPDTLKMMIRKAMAERILKARKEAA
jgi:hypothetical protein